MSRTLGMAPSSAPPPERHFGYRCCNCQEQGFAGRRYACWMCIDYQLCGGCYDAGQLPEAPEHKYFHPLEAHYTRAEYEMYFGGESYIEANVPQSYKCALCDLCGFTSMQLYKHLSDVHRDHKDFDEYFSILYTRYAADASITSGRLTAGGGAETTAGAGHATGDAGGVPTGGSGGVLEAGSGSGRRGGVGLSFSLTSGRLTAGVGRSGSGSGGGNGQGAYEFSLNPGDAAGAEGAPAGASGGAAAGGSAPIPLSGRRGGVGFSFSLTSGRLTAGAGASRSANGGGGSFSSNSRRLASGVPISGGGGAGGFSLGLPSGFMRSTSPRAALSQRNLPESAVSFRDAVRMTQVRRAALLEQQALTMLEELRLSLMHPNQEQQAQQQQQYQQHAQPPPPARSDVAAGGPMRNPKSNRLRGRLSTLFPKPNSQFPRRVTDEDWVSFWEQSATLIDQPHRRAESLLTSYADVLRAVPGTGHICYHRKDKNKTGGKTNGCNVKSDLNKFLCSKFLTMDKSHRKNQEQLPPDPQRMLFTEAILCSMLADEKLDSVAINPADLLLTAKRTAAAAATARKAKLNKTQKALEETLQMCCSSAGIMHRFYKNLDLYSKWLAEFATKKLEGNSKVAGIPDLILQATHDPVAEDIDSDVDADTDERDEEDDLTSVEAGQSSTKTENQANNNVTINIIDELSESEVLEDEEQDDEHGDGEVEGEGDIEFIEDDDEDVYEENSGSETSDSTIAMLVNEMNQVYGF